MEEKIYEFECSVEYEKFYSEDSFYGCYNVTTKDNLPKSELYKMSDFGEGESNLYFISIAGKVQRLYLGCKYKMTSVLEFNKRYNCWQYVPKTVEPIKPNGTEDTRKFL